MTKLQEPIRGSPLSVDASAASGEGLEEQSAEEEQEEEAEAVARIPLAAL